jgi:lipopolysaccharide transport system ATP-binding protein
MHVRLGFAVAAHLEPEILVVDEVLAVGDAEFQKKCLGKMKSVSGEGRTVLFVSHNMGAIQNLCTRALYLKNGLLFNSGPTDKIIAEYLANESSIAGSVSFDTKEELAIQVKDIKILDSKKGTAATLLCGEPLSIELGLEMHEAKGNIEIGIGIADSMDFNVYSEKSVSFQMQKGTKTINYTNTETVLAPGNYLLTVNVFFNGKSTDYKEKILAFEVSELTTNAIQYTLRPGEGAIVTKGEFKIK